MSEIPVLRVIRPSVSLPPEEVHSLDRPSLATVAPASRRVPYPEGLLSAYFAFDHIGEAVSAAKTLFSLHPQARDEPNIRAYNDICAAAKGSGSPPPSMELSVEEFRMLHSVLSLRRSRPQVQSAGGFLVDRSELLEASNLHKIQRKGRRWKEFPPGPARRRMQALQALASRPRPLLVVSRPTPVQTNCTIRYTPLLKVADLSTWDEHALEAFPNQIRHGKDAHKFWIRLSLSLETRFHRLLDQDYIGQIAALKAEGNRVSSHELAGIWWCYFQWKPELEIHREKLARKLKIPTHQIFRRKAALASRMRRYYETWKALGLLLDFDMGRHGREGVKDCFRFNPDKLLHLKPQEEVHDVVHAN